MKTKTALHLVMIAVAAALFAAAAHSRLTGPDDMEGEADGLAEVQPVP